MDVICAILTLTGLEGPSRDGREHIMTRKDIETSIKSYQARLSNSIRAAHQAIDEGSWWVAQLKLGECISYEAVINELEFQLEAYDLTE